MVNDSSWAPAHNTPVPLKRSPPASFKRLLGGNLPRIPPSRRHLAASNPHRCSGCGGDEGTRHTNIGIGEGLRDPSKRIAPLDKVQLDADETGRPNHVQCVRFCQIPQGPRTSSLTSWVLRRRAL